MTRRVARGLAAAGLALGAGWILVLAGAAPRAAPSAAAADAGASGTIESRLSELTGEIERAAAAAAAADSAAAAELDRLEQLRGLLDQQRAERSEAEELAAALRAAEGRSREPPSGAFSEEPPHALSVVDALADVARAQAEQTRRLEGALRELEASLTVAREAHEENERNRRLAKEALEEASGAQRDERLRRLRERELASRVSGATLELRRLELENARQAVALQHASEARVRDALEWARAHMALRDDELADALTALEKERFDLERRLEAARLELASSERALEQARRRLDAAAEPDAALRDEVEARKLQHALWQRTVAFGGERLQRLERSMEIWKRRYRLLSGGVPRAQLGEWLDELRAEAEEAERRRRVQEARLAELRRDLEAARAAASDAGLSRWSGRRVDALAEFERLYEADLASAARARALADRLLAELAMRSEQVAWTDRLRSLRDGVGEVWRYEIAASEDRPITVGKIATGISIFLLGYLAARLFSRTVGRRVFPRFGFDEGAAHAFELLVFYALLVVIFLVALRSVSIPLTAFAVVGGALAIGVGFGSQNIVNNFISGVILLAERPIKLGDLVEVGGIYGSIERIGLRSTRVRTGDNIHIIVPNSSFLETNVVNWTHNNETVRVKLPVGVVYGSPTREVERLLRKAIEEHPMVLEEPTPIILFTEFGDNALGFEARFWIRMRDLMARLRVESELRFRIDDLFREAGIVIAFPQRDVHLDAAAPLEVRVVRDAAPSPGTGGED